MLASLLCFVLIGQVSPTPKPQTATNLGARIDVWAKEQMVRDHIPGMVVGIFRHGKPLKVGAYGFSDLENSVPMTQESIFGVGSITKQFTAVGILLLEQEHKLALDDFVDKYIPEWPKNWHQVRLVDFLTHTSGINDDLYPVLDEKVLPLPSYFKLMAGTFTLPPGEAWEYSNFGYVVLGHVIEKASGKGYYQFLEERIFYPLGMKDTHPNSTATVIPRRVRDYSWNGRQHLNARPITDAMGLGDGGLLSTAADLNRWSQALKHQTLLKPELRSIMLEPARLKNGEVAWPDGMASGYGLGVFLGGSPGHRVEKHSGGTLGASTQLIRFLDDDLTIVVLTNVGGWSKRPWVGEEVAHLLSLKIKPPSWTPRPDPDPSRLRTLERIWKSVESNQIPKDLVSEREARFLSLPGIANVLKRLDLGKLQFVDSFPQNGSSIVLYRMVGAQPTIVWFRFDQQKKLAHFSSYPIVF